MLQELGRETDKVLSNGFELLRKLRKIFNRSHFEVSIVKQLRDLKNR